jgi:hypothetical protein
MGHTADGIAPRRNCSAHTGHGNAVKQIGDAANS